MSANSLLMHAVPLTFREEAREDTSTHTILHEPEDLFLFIYFFFFDT